MKEINHNAPVQCSKSVTIDAGSKDVWRVLAGIGDWTTWNTEVSHVKMHGALEARTTFDWNSGGAKIRSTLHTVEPFGKLGWTGRALGTFAIHNWTLTEAGGQTKVFVEESMEGLLPRLFKKSFRRNLEKGMQKWLLLLKDECEK